jgi:hypothetical protein
MAFVHFGTASGARTGPLVIAGVLFLYSALKFSRAAWWGARPCIRITDEGFELATSLPPVSYTWATIEGIDWVGKNCVYFRLVNGERVSLMLHFLTKADRRAFVGIARTALKKGTRIEHEENNDLAVSPQCDGSYT